MGAPGIELPLELAADRDEGETAVLLESLLDHLADGIFAIDRAGRVLYWSASMERLSGLPSSAAVGRPVSNWLDDAARALLLDPPQSASPRDAAARAACASRGPAAAPHAARFVSARATFPAAEVPMRLAAVAAAGLSGRRLGTVCAATDLRKSSAARAEDERTKALAVLGETAATIVHQLRNPLGGALGFLGLARLEAGEGPAVRLIDQACAGLDEVERRIAELLRFARAQAPRRETVALAPLLSALAGLFRARYPEGPRLEIVMEEPAHAYADPEQLKQALENLLTNAAEEAGRAGRVALLVQSAGRPAGARGGRDGGRPAGDAACGETRILVRNTGGRLRPGEIERIFEPFVSNKKGGTGLGLALVKRIVSAHGGSVSALSAAGWTTFVVRLPSDPARTIEEIANHAA